MKKNADVRAIEAALSDGSLTLEELEGARASMKAGKLVQFDSFEASSIVLFANYNQMICWAEEIEIAASSLFKKVLER